MCVCVLHIETIIWVRLLLSTMDLIVIASANYNSFTSCNCYVSSETNEHIVKSFANLDNDMQTGIRSSRMNERGKQTECFVWSGE